MNLLAPGSSTGFVQLTTDLSAVGCFCKRRIHLIRPFPETRGGGSRKEEEQRTKNKGLVKLKTLQKVLHIWWHPQIKVMNDLFCDVMTDLFCDECNICGSHNSKKPYQTPMGSYPVPNACFQDISIDYTDMGVDNVTKGKRYLLVMVDRFSKWVEAIPTAKEDARSVIKWLQTKLIPRYGIPRQIKFDKWLTFQ